ncbi:MAG: hypothetical protein JSW47_08585 [Phycisphaerales bacterium]|nr:MAG: hypothetical protein JSW47_08585 [Phycisphaerales bacterium]
MRPIVTILVVVLCISLAFADYDVPAFTIDAGGDTSSGGDFSLTATIGQPHAGVMTGGDFELAGGFAPGGPMCIVGFDDFARFVEEWLHTGDGLDADLDTDRDVDYYDLQLLTEEWLRNCPTGWRLR